MEPEIDLSKTQPKINKWCEFTNNVKFVIQQLIRRINRRRKILHKKILNSLESFKSDDSVIKTYLYAKPKFYFGRISSWINSWRTPQDPAREDIKKFYNYELPDDDDSIVVQYKLWHRINQGIYDIHLKTKMEGRESTIEYKYVLPYFNNDGYIAGYEEFPSHLVESIIQKAPGWSYPRTDVDWSFPTRPFAKLVKGIIRNQHDYSMPIEGEALE